MGRRIAAVRVEAGLEARFPGPPDHRDPVTRRQSKSKYHVCPPARCEDCTRGGRLHGAVPCFRDGPNPAVNRPRCCWTLLAADRDAGTTVPEETRGFALHFGGNRQEVLVRRGISHRIIRFQERRVLTLGELHRRGSGDRAGAGYRRGHGEMPEPVGVAAINLQAAAAGIVRPRTTVLLTPEEIDQASKTDTGLLPPTNA